jgi:hypothetical protein
MPPSDDARKRFVTVTQLGDSADAKADPTNIDNWFFGLLVMVNAQAASSSSAAPFDGTYRFISAEKVNETYTSYNGQTGMCPSRRPGPLHVT